MAAPDHLKAHLFKPGDPNHPSKVAGMEAANVGAANYRKLQKRFAQLFEDPAYWENFVARAKAGKLAPAVEAAAMHYYAGKPKDAMDRAMGTDPGTDLAALSADDLVARREALEKRLVERKRFKEAQQRREAERDQQRDALGIKREWDKTEPGSHGPM